MPRPDLHLVSSNFHNYVNQVPENDLLVALENQTNEFFPWINSIPVEKRSYAYAPGKWTIQEVLQHLIDAERVFTYRALCFARKDKTILPSFDENEYALNSLASARRWEQMIEEFIALRKATYFLFKSFNEDQLASTGVSGSAVNYVLGLGYITTGHVHHHARIIKERYL